MALSLERLDIQVGPLLPPLGAGHTLQISATLRNTLTVILYTFLGTAPIHAQTEWAEIQGLPNMQEVIRDQLSTLASNN
ncbi:MAG TPA: hypothetical protein DIT35_10220 [Rhodospirillaceae bacterium]|nr:hypothetical protein [Rhodospirillaceae bacterium]